MPAATDTLTLVHQGAVTRQAGGQATLLPYHCQTTMKREPLQAMAGSCLLPGGPRLTAASGVPAPFTRAPANPMPG